MATQVLTTKLCVPPPRPGLVHRPRLLKRLDEGLGQGHRLVLISAPAGFGKTTLLAEWAASLEASTSVAWLSLDEGDNDPTRFLAYLVAALQAADARFGQGAQAPLQPSGMESTDTLGQAGVPPAPEELLTALINRINAVPGQCVLILDDYHLITAQPVHKHLTFLLDRLPHHMHLAIATRVDPPLAIARLRARGQLTEIRLADLRFTSDEAAAFLNRVMRLALATGDVTALASRTEGWIAGLQMAALALQAKPPHTAGPTTCKDDRSRFIQTFTGSDRYVMDYLVEEVLRRQPELIQAFLLQTSVLDRLTAPLCDAVVRINESADQRVSESADQRKAAGGCTESAKSNQELYQVSEPAEGRFADLQIRRFADLSNQQILEYLERNNLFVLPLDNERRWYRYHRLFADLLRKRLHQKQPDLVPALHRRASRWYEQNGLLADGIDHALAAADFERAAELIEQATETTLMRSEIATFLRWVEALPDELVRARPSLCLFHAWALLLSGSSLDAIESRLQGLDEGEDLIAGGMAALRARIAILQGHVSQAVDLSHQALEWLPEDDSFLRTVTLWTLGMSHLAGGNALAGSRALEEAARTSRGAGNVMVAVVALCRLAGLWMVQGHLKEARAMYERALALATDEEGNSLPIAGEALIGLGELAREWNDLEAATHHLTQGIELSRQWREAAALGGIIALARIRQAQGDMDGAQHMVERARQLAAQSDATEADDLTVALYQARLWIAQGNVEAVERWATERGLYKDADAAGSGEGDGLIERHLRKYEHIVMARLRLVQGRPEQALTLLDSLLPRARRLNRNKLLIEIHTLRALAFQARASARGATREGRGMPALDALEQALSLAEPEGYVRIFIEEGEPMAALLRQIAARGIAVDYVSRLLAALELEQPRPAIERTPTLKPETQLIEPLSERELEILRLIAVGLSNREIAEELVVAVSTVKWHINNLYDKLDVRSRTQAIARARESNLL